MVFYHTLPNLSSAFSNFFQFLFPFFGTTFLSIGKSNKNRWRLWGKILYAHVFHKKSLRFLSLSDIYKSAAVWYNIHAVGSCPAGSLAIAHRMLRIL